MARSDKSNHIAAECKVQEAMAENENRCQHHVHSADRASSRDVRSPFRFLRKSKSLSAVEIDVCLAVGEARSKLRPVARRVSGWGWQLR